MNESTEALDPVTIDARRRANQARPSLALYANASGDDDWQTNLADLLADLQHLAAVDGLDWLHAVASAEMHVIAERRGE
jgi:hypothetical protein